MHVPVGLGTNVRYCLERTIKPRRLAAGPNVFFPKCNVARDTTLTWSSEDTSPIVTSASSEPPGSLRPSRGHIGQPENDSEECKQKQEKWNIRSSDVHIQMRSSMGGKHEMGRQT